MNSSLFSTGVGASAWLGSLTICWVAIGFFWVGLLGFFFFLCFFLFDPLDPDAVGSSGPPSASRSSTSGMNGLVASIISSCVSPSNIPVGGSGYSPSKYASSGLTSSPIFFNTESLKSSICLRASGFFQCASGIALVELVTWILAVESSIKWQSPAPNNLPQGPSHLPIFWVLSSESNQNIISYQQWRVCRVISGV